MAGKNIKLIQNEIADAVEKFNSRHDKKLVFKSDEKIKNCSEICYIAKYSFGYKEVQLKNHQGLEIPHWHHLASDSSDCCLCCVL